MSIINRIIDFVLIVDEQKNKLMTGILIKDMDGQYKTLCRSSALSNLTKTKIQGNFEHIKVLEQYGFEIKPLKEIINPYIKRTLMIRKINKNIKEIINKVQKEEPLITEELIEYCKIFNWKRKPYELHIHHTWKPCHNDFNGKNHKNLHNAMKNYHINIRKWSDIGQHLTLFPDGKWIIGRDFNKNPASIRGRNGLGFAIEMIGNFDKGQDKFEGEQKQAMLQFSKFFIEFFNLDFYKDIVFHRQYSKKTCPGTSINRSRFIEEVINYK